MAVIAFGQPARADFQDGLAAYDAGNYTGARRHWLPLAQAGNGDAQAAIAGLYAAGLLSRSSEEGSTFHDREMATRWYRRAATCGHTIAQLNLGDFYARGVGVGKNPVQAHFWLSLAARAGNEWAAGRLRDVAGQLTGAQSEEAERALAGWQRPNSCTELP